MTPRPPDGFDDWLGWCVQNAEYRDLWIERDCPMGDEQPHYMKEAATAELAALRARAAELEKLNVDAGELHLADESTIRQLEQWKKEAMRVLGEHHDALQRHGTLGESAAGCMDRLAQQVAALADGLQHAVHRNHAPSGGCDGCVGIDAALRAAGRNTNG